MVRALIIDSPNQHFKTLSEYLKRHHFEVRQSDTWESVMEDVRTHQFDVILSSTGIPEISQESLAKLIDHTLLVELTSSKEKQKPQPACESFPKNTSPEVIKSIIEKSLLIKKLQQENCSLKQEPPKSQTPASPPSRFTTRLPWQNIVEHLHTAVVVVDSEQNLLHANQKFENLSGYSRAELNRGLKADNLFKNNSLAKYLSNSAHSNESQVSSVEMLQKDGKRIQIQLCHQRLPQNDLHVLMLQLPALEKKVLAQKNNQLALINNLILKINQLQSLNEVLRITNKELLKLVGADICFIHLWDRPKGALRLAWLSGEQDKQKLQVDYLKKNNQLWWQHIKKREALFVENGQTSLPSHPLSQSDYSGIWYLPLSYKRKLLGLITLGFMDAGRISDELKRLLNLLSFQIGMTIENIQLKQAQTKHAQEIQKRNNELRSFIYTVSHDLKSPLVALYGFADLLKENYSQMLDENGQDYLKRILVNSELMHRMIDDLLELSRIGRVLGPRSKFSTRRLVEELVDIYNYQIRKKNIKLIYPDKMPIIYADRERIATVFQNLLTNSIKYSRQEPPPEIRIEWTEQKNDYLFSVIDNGIGISKQNRNKIFNLFQKFGDETSNEGTGVGLTIARKILEHHGGKIWVESEENVGTTFYFTIPKYSRVRK